MFGPLGDGTPVRTAKDREARQRQIRHTLADTIYGDIPPAPDHVQVTRTPIAGETAERVEIGVTVGDRTFRVDAALWLPTDVEGPVPIICGLDFVGPAGVLTSHAFPLDPDARIYYRGANEGGLSDALRGTATQRWPIDLLLRAGHAVMISCYGSWAPDDPDDWTQHGVSLLFDHGDVGAISLWAWAISRMLDAAECCSEINLDAMSVAGHSRLGKAALWAAAHDTRIAQVFANQSGCGGASPAAHPVGETLAEMAEHFPHWTRANPSVATCDQHHLLALVAPRAVYLAGAQNDLWSDPLGSFAALQAASAFWDLDDTQNWVWPTMREVWDTCGSVCNGPLGFHLRAGTHDVLPQDWQNFLNFLKPH